jgi:hypothetical protein
MGLHAGFYTQHGSNRGTRFVDSHDSSSREIQSYFMKEFLKSMSNQLTCSRCRQKFSLDGSLPDWLGEREEGP